MNNEVKNFTPMDMALLRRVAAQSICLDIAESIQDSHPLETAMLNIVGLRGRPTFVLRTDEADFAAQMRVEGAHVRITLLAPMPEYPYDDAYPWLALIDAMVRQGGRHGATVITAEVPVGTASFEILRRAGFIVYSRESLYHLDREKVGDFEERQPDRLTIRPIEENDYARLYALYANTVPQLVQQVSPPPQNGWRGLALLLDDRLMGCLATCSDKRSVLIQPYLHPELYDLVAEVIALSLPFFPNRTLYVRLRAYQEWLRHALEYDFGFEERTRYALVARHTVIQRTTASLSPLTVLEHAFSGNNIEVALEISSSEKLNKT